MARYLQEIHIRMEKMKSIATALIALFVCAFAYAQDDGAYDVFVPISKYIRQGDAVKLSAWFADNLEVSVLSSTNDSSRNQARQIVKNFFDTYTPRSFEISHKASNANMKYALGYLNAGGEQFLVTIFVNLKTGAGKDSPTGTYQIQQLKIERQTGVY